MTARSLLAGAVAIVALASPARAHRVGVPITEITPNPRTGLWEVVHRLSLHDLEAQLISEGIAPTDFYDSAERDRRVRERIARQFGLEGRDTALRLDYVGHETDRDFLWVYFEFESPDQAVEIDNTLLFEGNTATGHALVNIRNGEGGVASARFAPGASRQTLMLCFEACTTD